MKLTRQVILIALLTALLAGAGACAYAADKPPFSEEFEKKIGAEAAAQVEKEYKLYVDEEAHARLVAMVNEITAASSRPDVVYDVRLLDTEDVNAFSLPGGIVYVTKGLLKEAGSDHEIAGVLAHEIAHNCTYDALDQADRSKKLFLGSISAALVAMVLGANTEQISGVITAGSYLQQGVLSHYSLEMERRADLNAVRFLAASKYNPVGLLTFMERLASGMFDKPQIDYGIYETHPQATERVGYIIQAIYDQGLEINRRAVSKWDPPTFESLKPEGAAEDFVLDPKTAPARITLWGEELITLTGPGSFEGIDQRAAAVCKTLTDAVAEGLNLYEIEVDDRGDSALVTVRGAMLLTLDGRDVTAEGSTPAMVAEQVVHALARAIHRERLQRRYH